MRDEVIALWRTGATYKEIAKRLGATRSAVAGHVYRHRHHTTVETRTPPTKEQIQAALAASGGKVSVASRALGYSGTYLSYRGYKPPKKPNHATDPATRTLVDEINASGVPDCQIELEVGLYNHQIWKWRYRKLRASEFLQKCVREYLTTKNTPGY